VPESGRGFHSPRSSVVVAEGQSVVQGGSNEAAGVREGDVLAGKYRVERVLGAGGMGVVVAAHHIQLDERVALKFLLPEALGDAEAVARFAREARNAVKIKSEHVARVIDVGALPNGAPYMVMEYLEGGDLAAWIKQRGALPIEQAIEFVLQACVAVADAHALGIVHRDLKPANLSCVRRTDGQLSIKVLDFGISKLADGAGTGSGMAMTRTAALMGSPLYMSPEQMRSAKDVDALTDIWALGIILVELMTGRPPFQAGSVTELAIKVNNEPTPAVRTLRPDVPADLEAVIFKCLEKDRNRRYRNVAELALALLPFAPKRAKASVERISGIIQGAGLSASALAVPPSPQVVDGTQVSGGTLPAVGRTTIGTRGGKTAIVGAGVLGALALVGGVTFAVLPKTVPEHHDEPQPAASHPAALPTVSEAVMTPPPLPSETSNVEPSATAPRTALSPTVATLATPTVTPSKPGKTPKTAQTPSVSAAMPGAATAAPAPVCTVATDYDSDGQPHFRKVCK
jgi:eukaryotic-like serine/threonine-protein kinase